MSFTVNSRRLKRKTNFKGEIPEFNPSLQAEEFVDNDSVKDI